MQLIKRKWLKEERDRYYLRSSAVILTLGKRRRECQGANEEEDEEERGAIYRRRISDFALWRPTFWWSKNSITRKGRTESTLEVLFEMTRLPLLRVAHVFKPSIMQSYVARRAHQQTFAFAKISISSLNFWLYKYVPFWLKKKVCSLWKLITSVCCV